MSQQWDGGYGAPPPGPYGPAGPYGPPPNQSVKNQSIAALVANIIAMVLCCGIVSIGGTICAAIAMSKADYEPETASKLNTWAWILLGATIALDVLYVVLVFVFPFALLPFLGASS